MKASSPAATLRCGVISSLPTKHICLHQNNLKMHIKNGLKISVIELTRLFVNKSHLAFSHCNVLGTK